MRGVKTNFFHCQDGVAFIPVGETHYAKVDVDDVPKVMGFRWRLKTSRNTKYARTGSPYWGEPEIGMHQLLCPVEDGYEPDHKDGDGLNNRRSNLRRATLSQNKQNTGPQKNCKSGFKGVCGVPQGGWRAKITYHRKDIHLGIHSTPEAAAKAYDAKALELYGDFARLNFPAISREVPA